jgi:hypothetical protein
VSKAFRLAEGFEPDGKMVVTPGGEGRYFIFERVALKLQLYAMWDWIA